MKGFTLIELLVVVSLTTVLMLTAASVFMTFMIGNEKTTVTQGVQSEGQHALQAMEFLLRNSIRLVPNSESYTCERNMSRIAFRNVDSGTTELYVENDASDNNIVKIASNSGVYLTSGEADLVIPGSTEANDPLETDGKLIFDCVTSPDGASSHVTISFSLRKGDLDLDEARDISQADFITGVTLRN